MSIYSFTKLHSLLRESIPEQLLTEELAGYEFMLWKGNTTPPDSIYKNIWNSKVTNKSAYQDLAKKLNISDDFAVFVMLRNYSELEIDHNITSLLKSDIFSNDLVVNVFTFHLKEQLFYIKCITQMLTHALDKTHPLNRFILVYLNGDNIPDISTMLWKKYTTLDTLSHKPYLNDEQDRKCVHLYFRQHIEILHALILSLNCFPKNTKLALLKEILIYCTKHDFLHASTSQLLHYHNSNFLVEIIQQLTVGLALTAVKIMSISQITKTEKDCHDLLKEMKGVSETSAPVFLAFSLLITEANTRVLGHESIKKGALNSIQKMLTFEVFTRNPLLLCLITDILFEVEVKLLDNFEIEPLKSSLTIIKTFTILLGRSEVDNLGSENVGIITETILEYLLNSFPIFFDATMRLFSALVPIITANRLISLLCKLENFNTSMMTSQFNGTEPTERCLAITTEVMQSQNCSLSIPGGTKGRVISWNGVNYVQWNFVYNAWTIFQARIELCLEAQNNTTEEALEETAVIFDLMNAIVRHDIDSYSNCRSILVFAPLVFVKSCQIIVHAGSLLCSVLESLNNLIQFDSKFLLIEMSDIDFFDALNSLMDNLVLKIELISNDKSVQFKVIVNLLNLLETFLIEYSQNLPDRFFRTLGNFLKQISVGDVKIAKNEDLIVMHSELVAIFRYCLFHTSQVNSCRPEVCSFVNRLKDFCLKNNTFIELIFFQFEMLDKLTNTQDSDFLMDQITQALVTFLNFSETLLTHFGNNYFSLLQNYIMRSQHSLIHLLSSTILSTTLPSNFILAALNYLKSICRHRNFSLMVCLGKTAPALKFCLIKRLKTSHLLMNTDVRIDVLKFAKCILQYQSSFAELLLSTANNSESIIAVVINLLSQHSEDRQFAPVVASCMSLLTVIWLERRDYFARESPEIKKKLWLSIETLIKLFYFKNLLKEEHQLELSLGLISILMVEFYMYLSVKTIDADFQRAFTTFMNEHCVENQFNLSFLPPETISAEYSIKQKRLAISLKQFIQLVSAKSDKHELLKNKLSRDNKNFLFEACFDQLQLMIKRANIEEINSIYYELTLCIITLLKYWQNAMENSNEMLSYYIQAVYWVSHTQNVTPACYKACLNGSLLFLQIYRKNANSLNAKKVIGDESVPLALLFSSLTYLFKDILRKKGSYDDIIFELIVLNFAEILQTTDAYSLVNSVTFSTLYYYSIESLRSALLLDEIKQVNSCLLLLTCLAKFDIFAKQQDLPLLLQIISDILYSWSQYDNNGRLNNHSVWCRILTLLTTALNTGKYTFLYEAKYYLNGSTFLEEINRNTRNSSCSVTHVRENYYLTMLVLFLSKFQDYQLNLDPTQIMNTLMYQLEFSVECLQHTEKLNEICKEAEHVITSVSKAREITIELGDAFSSKTEMNHTIKLWFYKTIRLSLAILHTLTPSFEKMIDTPSLADMRVYCFLYNFQEISGNINNKLLQPVSALCCSLHAALELLNKIPALTPSKSPPELPINQGVKKVTSSFSWIKNLIETTLSLLISQSYLVLMSPLNDNSKKVFKHYVAGEIENFLVHLLRVLNKKNIQTTPIKSKRRLTLSMITQLNYSDIDAKTSCLGFNSDPEQIFFMTIDNFRKQLF